jgi:hypothetical protein
LPDVARVAPAAAAIDVGFERIFQAVLASGRLALAVGARATVAVRHAATAFADRAAIAALLAATVDVAFVTVALAVVAGRRRADLKVGKGAGR